MRTKMNTRKEKEEKGEVRCLGTTEAPVRRAAIFWRFEKGETTVQDGRRTTDRGWLEVKKRMGGDEVAEGGKSRVRSSRGRVFFSLPFCFYFYLFLILPFLLSRPLSLTFFLGEIDQRPRETD